eukprot:3214018-Prymnesium_polylepis.1
MSGVSKCGLLRARARFASISMRTERPPPEPGVWRDLAISVRFNFIFKLLNQDRWAVRTRVCPRTDHLRRIGARRL